MITQYITQANFFTRLQHMMCKVAWIFIAVCLVLDSPNKCKCYVPKRTIIFLWSLLYIISLEPHSYIISYQFT